MALEKITTGDTVQLTSEAKEELVSKYKLSKGMGGIYPSDVNKKFIVTGFDGCNICVRAQDSEEILYSFHYGRFETKEKLN